MAPCALVTCIMVRGVRHTQTDAVSWAIGNDFFDPFAPLSDVDQFAVLPLFNTTVGPGSAKDAADAPSRSTVVAESESRTAVPVVAEAHGHGTTGTDVPLLPDTSEYHGWCVMNPDVLPLVASRLISILPPGKQKQFFKHISKKYNASPIVHATECSGADVCIDGVAAILKAASTHPDRPDGFEPRELSQAHAAECAPEMLAYLKEKPGVKPRVLLEDLGFKLLRPDVFGWACVFLESGDSCEPVTFS